MARAHGALRALRDDYLAMELFLRRDPHQARRGALVTGSMFDHALGYAARDWRVFVLSSSKVPVRNCAACNEGDVHDTAAEKEACPCLTCHGFYAASTDPDRIAEMIRRHPRGMLAIRTGAVSGLAVVDVDIRTWAGDWPAPNDPGYLTMSEMDRLRLLPGTLMQTTGSGGLHFLYAHPGPGDYLLSGAEKYGPGVDSKADGGYIVASPSVTSSGRYRWTPDGHYDHPVTPLPEALADRIRPPAVSVVVAARKATGPRGVRTRLGGLVTAILDAETGHRNDLLHWAAKKAGEMVAANEIDQRTVVAVLQDAATQIGLTATEIGDDIRGTIGSGLRKGLAARSAA